MQKHILSQEDFDNNPGLVEQGLSVGDEVEIASAEEMKEILPESSDSYEEDMEDGDVIKDVNIMASKIQNYEVPEKFEGHEITSILGMKFLSGVMYITVTCDDQCTYDVPITLKK